MAAKFPEHPPRRADQYRRQLESPICMAVGTSGWLSCPQTPNLVLSLSLNYKILPNAYWQAAGGLVDPPSLPPSPHPGWLSEHETSGEVAVRMLPFHPTQAGQLNI